VPVHGRNRGDLFVAQVDVDAQFIRLTGQLGDKFSIGQSAQIRLRGSLLPIQP
jgi:hypothetical protein